MSRIVPVDAKRADWPRLVANAINRLQSELRDITVGAADGVVSAVALNGTSLDFTGAGGGFDGSVDLSSLSGGSGFTPADLSASDATYLYFGFDTSPWRVRRVLRADGTADEATQSNNGSYANLTAAWPDRAILTYV